MSKPYIRRRDPLWKGGQSSFECKYCKKVFINKYEFKRHLKTKDSQATCPDKTAKPRIKHPAGARPARAFLSVSKQQIPVGDGYAPGA